MATATDYRPIAEDRKDDSELKDELTVPPTSFPKPGKPGPKLIRRYSEQVFLQQLVNICCFILVCYLVTSYFLIILNKSIITLFTLVSFSS